MKVFKTLFAVAAIALCFASCSRHTTCSAYGASIYQLEDNQDEVHVQATEKNVESM